MAKRGNKDIYFAKALIKKKTKSEKRFQLGEFCLRLSRFRETAPVERLNKKVP